MALALISLVFLLINSKKKYCPIADRITITIKEAIPKFEVIWGTIKSATWLIIVSTIRVTIAIIETRAKIFICLSLEIENIPLVLNGSIQLPDDYKC